MPASPARRRSRQGSSRCFRRIIRPSRWLPAANDEPWSAVAAIVVAGASVVVVAPAGEVAGVIVIAQDMARSSGPPAASIILVADETDLIDVGDVGGADRRRVEGRGRSGGRE